MTENTEQFREAASAMLQRFAADGSTIIKYYDRLVMRTRSEAVDDYELPITLRSRNRRSNPESDRFRVVEGAILYRAGRHDEAIERLTEVARRYKSSDHRCSSSDSHTLGTSSAMAHMADWR